ncbi:MAG: endonuclease V [Oceanospirillales bacterium LUC14_002_19_P2]|nr:MAG: endonuclease V [Oceanospirillales bacterium LUC14_002_19_P2]
MTILCGNDDVTPQWTGDPSAARALQTSWSRCVIRENRLPPLRFVAGADVGFESQGTVTRAVLVVLSWPSLAFMDYSVARLPTVMPYIPGLLSFRECPALLKALGELRLTPDLVLCDGQGIAHHRRFGVASHFGVLSGLPTIGVAKSRLCGQYEDVGNEPGASKPLLDEGECIGKVLRTRVNVKPVYVSIGHKVDLDTALDLVKQATPRYRLPEPIRWADGIASRRLSFMKRLRAIQNQ